MSAIQPLHSWIALNSKNFSKEEIILLEAELFIQICNGLKEFFRKQHNNYFRIMKFNSIKEDQMLEANFLRLIIKDILNSEEYDLTGIACYADVHEDVIQEITIGQNNSPSVTTFRKILELHRSVRKELYSTIMKKVTVEHLFCERE